MEEVEWRWVLELERRMSSFKSTEIEKDGEREQGFVPS